MVRRGHLEPLISVNPIQGAEPLQRGSETFVALTAIRQAAVQNLTDLLVTVTCGMVLVALFTTLTTMWARSCARGREIAIRRAVGAPLRGLRAAELLEGLFIAVPISIVGGAVGLMFGSLARQAWPGMAASPSSWPRVATFGLVLLFTMWSATVIHFKGGAIASKALPGETTIALSIPMGQLGITVALLVVGKLISDHGFRQVPRADVVASESAMRLTSKDTVEFHRGRLFQEILRASRQATGGSAALASPGMVVGLGDVDMVWTECGKCFLGGVPVPIEWEKATQFLVGEDSATWHGPRLVEGRLLRNTDTLGAPAVAVISQSLTKRFEAGKPLGRGLTIGSLLVRYKAVRYVVVGVVEDQNAAGFGGALLPPSAIYLSILQQPIASADLIVPSTQAANVRTMLMQSPQVGHAIDVRPARSLASIVAAEQSPVAWFGRMITAEGWLMVIVAVMGVTMMTHLWVESVVPELGVRVSVGATKLSVRLWVVARMLGVAIGGLAVSLWMGIVLWGELPDTIKGLESWQPRVFLECGLPVVVLAILGALVTAWRATSPPPIVILEADDA